MQSAENKAYVDSKIAVREIFEACHVGVGKQDQNEVPNNFIKHVLQKVFRKVWAISGVI